MDSVQVRDWLDRLKRDRESALDFPEFVTQYTALFAGEDPDVPAGEKTAAAGDGRRDNRGSDGAKRPRRDADDRWRDEDDDERDGRDRSRDRDDWRDTDSGRAGAASSGDEAGAGSAPKKDILDIKVLAELKSVFDRFAVDGCMTPPETCQALTEAGIVAPRREIAQYLRSRQHLGLARNITFFEFIRAFAAIRGPTKRPASTPSAHLRYDDERDRSRDRDRDGGRDGRDSSRDDLRASRDRERRSVVWDEDTRDRDRDRDRERERGRSRSRDADDSERRDRVGSRSRSVGDREDDRDRHSDRRDDRRDRYNDPPRRGRDFDDDDDYRRSRDRDSRSSRDGHDWDDDDDYGRGRSRDSRDGRDGADRDRRSRSRDRYDDDVRASRSPSRRSREKLREGDKVEAQFKGKGKW